MTAKKKPLKLAAGEAEKKSVDGCLQNTPLTPACQEPEPISCIIRRIFMERLVSKPFTRKRSLQVDGLLVCAEFFEGCGYAWN